jgi:hypothetical protein
MDPQALEALLERAAEKGARDALQSIGLHDDGATKDVHELRSLLDAWRSAKKTAWRTVTQAVTMALLGALVAGSYINYFKGK